MYEEFYLLGYNAIQFAENQEFWKNMSPPSAELRISHTRNHNAPPKRCLIFRGLHGIISQK
jgi:hypothetical protein